ncbi:MAG: porin [Bacteroidetes bacterium]|nr:porin [Bacteroidota bacterium]
MKFLFTFVFLVFWLGLNAQKDSTAAFTFSAYGELYYSYDFSKPINNEKPNFIYNHKKHNQIDANLIFAKVSYNKKNVRANVAAMAGNYPQYNLASEPTFYQHILEANAGIKLFKNIWLDAGIMPSHIGFESAISADCFTPTRSMLAENSPYFETGIKLSTSSKNQQWSYSILLLNGWQKINAPSNIKQPSFGLQCSYKPNDKLLLNYSNFIGSDKPDSMNAVRVYHNIYVQYFANKKLAYTVGLDIGKDKYDNVNYGYWLSPIAIVKYTIKNNFALAARAEYFNDNKEIMIQTNIGKGFKVWGLSVNTDYSISDKILCRLEGKLYSASENIFSNYSKAFIITSNISFKL